MYQQFDPALMQAIDASKQLPNAGKISMTTPDGKPTVMAGIMQQTGAPPQGTPPPQGMPPPQAMPPPQPGLPGMVNQMGTTAQSVAEKMQRDQAMQEAQRMAQAQQQQPMMAEGGIASLPTGMDEYADGGIVGYEEGGQVGDEGSLLRKLQAWLQAGRPGLKKPLIESLLASEEAAKPSEPEPMVPMIPNKGLDQPSGIEGPARSAMAAEQPRPTPRPREGIEQALPPTPQDTSESLYRQRLTMMEDAKNDPTARTVEQVNQQRLANRRARGLPEDPNEMTIQDLQTTAAMQQKIREAQLAKEGPERQAGWLESILAPASDMGEMFRNAARGVNKVKREQLGNPEARAKEDLLNKQVEQAIRKSMRAAQYAELEGDEVTVAAEKEKIRKLIEARRIGKMDILKDRASQLSTKEEGVLNRAATAANYGRSNELFDRAYQIKLAELAQLKRNPQDPAVQREAYEYAIGQTKGTTSRADIADADRAVKIEALKAKDAGYKLASTMYALETDSAKKAAHLATMQDIESRYGLSPGGARSPSSIMTMADVQATAAKSGKSVEEVIQTAKARGYTIQ